MSWRTLQYAPCLLKNLLPAVVAIGVSACQSGATLSPTLTGGLWSNYYMATASGWSTNNTPKQEQPAKQETKTATAQAAQSQPATTGNSQCILQTVAYEATTWNDRLPPEENFGTSSLDFIKGVYDKVCQPVLKPVRVKKLQSTLSAGLNPGSVVVLGQEGKRIAALVEKCRPDGTCQAAVRLPDQVHTIKFNTNYPHVYQNKRGEVINTLMKVPGSQRVATAGELLLEVHQAYGRGQNPTSMATTNDD